jgi:hypothetical protein
MKTKMELWNNRGLVFEFYRLQHSKWYSEDVMSGRYGRVYTRRRRARDVRRAVERAARAANARGEETTAGG